MKRRIRLVGVVALILGLVVGGTVWAAEATRPGWLKGQVVSVGDASLTIRTQDGQVLVLTDDETTFRVPGVSDAALADIQPGAFVLVRTKGGEDGALTARAIVVQPPPRLQSSLIRGTVTAVAEEEVSIETAGGETATLLITDKARLWVPGEPPTTTLELEAGDPVLALGEPVPGETGDKTVSVRLVVVANDEDLPKVAVQGRAVAVTRMTIVLQTGRGERAITVLPRTRLWSAGGQIRSLRDVHEGEQIIAFGQPTELGQWIAGLVLLPGAEPVARYGLRGEVLNTDAEARTLLVQTERRGQITVVTSEQTRYRIPGIEVPGFADIQVGDRIVAAGRFDEQDPAAFLARGISVVAPREGKKEA